MATTKAVRKRKIIDPNQANETKSQRFTRLANSRVPKALKAITILGNLGSAGYESTNEQREKIHAALTTAIDEAMGNMNRNAPKTTTTFQL